MAAPLAGLRVVELAAILAGPATGQFLAEAGAEVIKVENPATGGDPTRGWRLPDEDASGTVSAYFACANWGKRSIALDVASEAGREVVHDLVRRADVVLASYKPGDAERLGVDPETLTALNPRLIDARISAYGDGDPRPGFDAVLQAESGFTFLNGEADGPPCKMPVALVDLLAAHQLKEALLLALLQRERDGQGRQVHVSLFDAALASLANQASNYLLTGQVPQRMGSEHPNIVPYGALFETRDRRPLVLAVGTDRQWRDLVQALGLDDLSADEALACNRGRVQERVRVREALTAAIGALDAPDVEARLRRQRVPFGFVNTLREVFALESSREVLLTEGGLRGVREFVARGVDRVDATGPPEYNADGESILREVLDYDAERRQALIASGGWPGPLDSGSGG